jgi:GNAT acetyltransferase-like protein
MKVLPYTPDHAAAWNAFVASSKNGTFLFHRDYMDYHRDRFEDASRLVYGDTGELAAVFPANRQGRVVVSHGGLTYGGLVIGPEMGTLQYLDVFGALAADLRSRGAESLDYKIIPPIYHQYPADEDKYALHLLGAELYRRDLSSVILPGKRLPLRKGRKSDLSKARRSGLRVEESDRWAEFWTILSDNLHEKHGLKPVHSLPEIQRLHGRFPANIRLFVVLAGEEAVAGTVIYETPSVAHAQYIGCNDAGRKNGALDILLSHLFDATFVAKPYFNFGISTTHDGLRLNRGLTDFKESFGARSVVQDCYRLNLKTANLSALSAAPGQG